MNPNEMIIALSIIFYSSDDGFQGAFDRLNRYTPDSREVRRLIDARFRAVLQNNQEPDILGEYLKEGGNYEEYMDITDHMTEYIITPSSVNGAITREMNCEKADKIREWVHDYEMDRITLDDLVAGIIDGQEEARETVTLMDLLREERVVELDRLKTGYGLLDYLLGGLAKRRITILAARPGVGKTDFSLAIARNALRSGHNVFLAALEADAHETLKRIESAEGSRDKIMAYKGRMEICDRGDSTVPQIAAAVNSGDFDLVIVDYLQNLSYPHKHNGYYEKATALSNQLRVAAKHSKAAWLVLSQFSREVKDEHTDPHLSALRDSGAIEQDAYAVVFLWEPEKRDANDHEQMVRTVNVKVAKNRGGKIGQVAFRFHMAASIWEEE